ncbi:MAG: membrane-associated protein [Rhizobiales bacterium 24-66-13]|jgi:membrane protein DedA with SNARE-associated domain|nr:MAG: membrane-associated protein [Rhizobiales bacterium 35-66-30]OYZ83052.1 MAG: membrane-associated protein [Rhizobiales bacterium 24-66-13]OZB12099.1 MAG: membrane-associated protein [Rhizobiales bacterium 39-66-18]HQS45293.1 VTT domain-containing protein [Xanthobacteraceae bacterium]
MDPLASLVDWIALYGVLGLFAVGLAERFVPALPSHGMLVAIGMAAVEDSWSLPSAFIMTTCGSLFASLALFLVVRAVGQDVSGNLLYGTRRLLGLPSKRIDRMLISFQARDRSLSLIAQIIPTVRFVAPLAAALLRLDAWRFAAGTLLGIALWNGVFLTAGYAAAQSIPDLNASALAIKFLFLVLAVEMLSVLIWRLLGRTNWCRTSSEDQAC